ncbi:molybdopterin oxidoreductase family protein [Candidatus Binatia bacterium]|nr:molybdopterin oxidoreductase family protein [Candidatus Binatia bacterium]
MPTRYRICPLCEATCGLALTVEGRGVTAVRGDDADVFSHGFVCPKGAALADLDTDPDRLREPLVRRDGVHVPVSWEDAFAEVERRLTPIVAAHGTNAVGAYVGNPNAHNLALLTYGQVFLRALRTPNIFSASTVDQIPKQLACGLMFGSFLSVPVPDIDRTDLLVILGANPVDSNGSLWTVPDFPGRLRALRQRGGRCVVVDPRRTRTAEAAGEHVAIRPGTDALFLFAIVNTLFAEGLVRPGSLADLATGSDAVRTAAAPFTPAAVAAACGISADTTQHLARDLAAAERAVVYGRIGTCAQTFGTLASWLVDVINILTGHLDRPGGAMFPLAPAFAANAEGASGSGRGVRIGRRHSRVRRAHEVMGELPTACLAEEIETPGEGQIRALFTVAGNPVLSTPNGARLARALDRLELMVSVDIYLNETTRHADIVLPGLSPLETGHYDVVFPQLAYRNAARYSPPVFAPPSGRPTEWEILLRLAGIVMGQGAGADLRSLDDFVIGAQVQRAVDNPHSPVHARDAGDIFAALAPRVGPERLVDLALRTGPYGDAFGARPGGLSLARLEAEPHGVDLGPLAPRLPDLLRTPSGKIELAPRAIMGDVARLRAALSDGGGERPFRLVGRRHLRSNNSWMHNLPSLSGGRDRCTLQVNPADAGRLGLSDGSRARITSRAGSVEAAVEVTAAIMPGVVSLPHGWGHHLDGTRLRLAAVRPGVNSNLLTDEEALDPISGNAVLNGIPVSVEAAAR